MSEQLYTQSRLKVLRSCLRAHYLRYTVGIRGPETAAMRFGTVAHAALEAYLVAWKTGALAVRLACALLVIDQANVDPADRARLRALIVAYDLRWGSEDWEILAAEVEFRYQLGDHLIGGKIDAIIRDRATGLVWIVEHKTTGQDASAGGTYWQRLAIDTQISIYVDGATSLGYEIAGCIYDVLARPKHEPLSATPVDKRKYTAGKGCKKCGGSAKAGEIEQGRGFYVVTFPGEPDKQIDCEGCNATGWKLDAKGVPEAPRLHSVQRDTDETIEEFADRVVGEVGMNVDDFLIRGTVVRLDDEMQPMRNDLLDTIRLERTAALFEAFPRNPDACAAYGSMCAYFPICSGRASADDTHLFPRSAVHSELAAAA